jgi:hypothetical protein
MSRPATDRLKCNPALGTPPVLQFVAPNQLHIDPTYQRTLDTDASTTLIRRIAQFWDWALCQPLIVARRADGKLYVIDGQHRLAAARLRRDIPHLPAVVLEYTSIADEAASFVHLNQQRRPLTKLDLFKAAVASGDSEATAITGALKEVGLHVAPHSNFTAWKPGAVSNVGGIENAWRKRGAAATRLALKAMAEGWRGQVLRYAGTLFPGLVAICAHEAGQSRVAFTPQSWAALIAMLSGRSQEDWRAAVLAARAADPDLDFRRASERAFLDAWERDEMECLVRGVETHVPAEQLGQRMWQAKPADAPMDGTTVETPRCAPPPVVSPPPKSSVRSGRPVIPTGLFGIGGVVKAKPAAASATARGTRKFMPGADRKDFCAQCDRRVGAGEMTACKDRFCTFKRGA